MGRLTYNQIVRIVLSVLDGPEEGLIMCVCERSDVKGEVKDSFTEGKLVE